MRSGIVRRADGFARFAVAVQYHGASFLGFSYQGEMREDCILPDGTDLRGYRSVEGRLREALTDLLGPEHFQWENIQVSSRTDRGVHALKNTLHVDVLLQQPFGAWDSSAASSCEILKKLRRGMNFHLSRQGSKWERDSDGVQLIRKSRTRKQQQPSYTFLGKDSWSRQSSNSEVRILSVAKAPELMANEYAHSNPEGADQPPFVDWNARYSATQRTYIYRVHCFRRNYDDEDEFGLPFEWDRSWRIRGLDCTSSSRYDVLDVDAMRAAAKHLEGQHDFSTFRGARCQRHSPIVTVKSIHIESQPYGSSVLPDRGDASLRSGSYGGLLGFGTGETERGPQLVTIAITGDSFLYRQVRNMVGCLVEVGKGRLSIKDVPALLQATDRSVAPNMAPAHGLFLVDVQHGSFHF